MVAFNPLDDRSMERLRAARDFSRRKLQIHRQNRFELLSLFIGKHYADRGSAERTPINLMELAVNIYQMNLAAQCPQVLVSTKNKNLKPQAADRETVINYWLQKMRFEEVMMDVVTEALFGMGIVKKGLVQSGSINIGGQMVPTTRPFIETIHNDNWVHDITARNIHECQFMGDKYLLPYDYVRESGNFENTGDLAPSEPTPLNEEGDEKASSLSQGYINGGDQFRDMLEVEDLYLPDDKLIITSAVGGGKPIKVQEWKGPDTGPYGFLYFAKVPDNFIPLAPASLWQDLHELANALFVKLGRQAERQKTIGVAQRGSEPDAERMRTAADGEMIGVDNPNAAQEMRLGGIDQISMAFLLQVKDLFSYFGGNLDSLGGLGIQSQTVGQDQLLSASASKRMLAMQRKTVNFAKESVSDMAYYVWDDPFINFRGNRRIPNVNIDIPVVFNRTQKMGEFWDYQIDIQPYSMQYETPGSKLQAIMNILERVIVPLLPTAQQQGITLNVDGLIRKIARYANMSGDLEDILVFMSEDSMNMQSGQAIQGGSGGGGGGMPNNTTRTYVREGRPGMTDGGKTAVMMQMLLGKKPQASEAANAMRMTG